MNTYSVTMTVSVNVTIEASSQKAARAEALGTFWDRLSEFDRRVDAVEDITPPRKIIRRGIGSY
jgi:hypothetical protein